MEPVAPSEPLPDGAIAEEELHLTLGLSRRQLREHRQNAARGVDWFVICQRVFWTPAGVEKLAGLLAPSPNGSESVAAPPINAMEASVDESPAQNGHHSDEELEVIAWQHANTRVVVCRRSGEGSSRDPIIVRVRDSRVFRNGMRLLARPTPIGAAWEFIGNPARPEAGARYPRRPGVW
jgi:hypothetical protein